MTKQIVSLCVLVACLVGGVNMAFADSWANTPDGKAPAINNDILDANDARAQSSASTTADTSASETAPTTVVVTEEIPGMKCESIGGTGPTSKKYRCTIESGFGSVMAILKGLIKYATFITALVGTLMLVYSGIEYSMAGASEGDVKHAKGRIMKVLAGLVLLFLIGFVLNTVAPWIYK